MLYPLLTCQSLALYIKHLSKVFLILIGLAWILQETLQHVPFIRAGGIPASGNLSENTPGIPDV